MISSEPTPRSAWLPQAANWFALLVLLAWICYDALGPNVFGYRSWPNSVVDYRILYEASRQVVADRTYPDGYLFPYPPSAVVLFRATAIPPFSVAAALWLAVTILATLGTLLLAMTLVGLDRHPWRWLAALAAFAVVQSFIQWDLRSQNSNMVYCFLLTAALAAIQRGWPALGGSLLAGSIAIKLYPILVLPYLWWLGQRRAALGVLAGLVCLFGLFPWLTFGNDVIHTYHSWLGQIQTAASTPPHADHPILVALPYTLTRLLDNMPVGPLLAKLAALAWLVGVALCLLAERRRGELRASGWNLAVDGSLLALTPVVISPYLEPYHPVPALLLTLALAQRAVDAALPLRWRLFAAASLLMGAVALKSFALLGFHYRGLGILAQMLVLTTSLTLLRWRPTVTAEATALPHRLAA